MEESFLKELEIARGKNKRDRIIGRIGKCKTFINKWINNGLKID